MKNLNLFAVALTAFAALASCNTAPQTQAPASPSEFFSQNSVKPQVKTVNVGTTPVTVTFAGGTALTFDTDSILDASSKPYTGPVLVEVKEVRSKADMIFSNVLTVSNGQPLVSGGMFKLDVKTPAGAALNINPAKGVEAQVPAVGPLNQKMQQFVGQDCLIRPEDGACLGPLPAGESSVNWQPAAGKFGINNSTTPGSYVFSVFNKGWINCDFFSSYPNPKLTLHVQFDGINDLNTIMFLIPKSVNTVISLYTVDGANGRKSYANSVPLGLQTELVAITFNGGKQYLAHKTITVAENVPSNPGHMQENLTFSEASDADIKAFLNGL